MEGKNTSVCLSTVAVATCHRYSTVQYGQSLEWGGEAVSHVSGIQVKNSTASSFLPVAQKTQASDT